MKRVAVVFHNYLRGGAETIVEALCRELRQHDYTFELFTNRVAENARQGAETAYNSIQIYPQPIAGFGREAAAKIAATIAPTQPDVIWLIGDDYDGVEQMRHALRPGGRLVFALHSVPFFQVRLKTRSRLNLWREKFFHTYSQRYLRRTAATLSAVDSYVVLCQGYAEQLRKLFPDFVNKIRVINNPVLTVAEPKTPTNTIAYVGRLTRGDKRVDNLLRILALAKPWEKGWKVRIIGDGPDRQNLEELAAELKLRNVEFAGFQSPPDLEGAQIVCLTSDVEGWPTALIEGMQQGAVPVAFGCSAGVSEILTEGRGIEIRPGDLRAYADALTRLMASPELRKQIAARAKPFLDSMQTKNIIEKWQQVL